VSAIISDCGTLGFIPGEPHSPKSFDDLKDNDSIWL